MLTTIEDGDERSYAVSTNNFNCEMRDEKQVVRYERVENIL